MNERNIFQTYQSGSEEVNDFEYTPVSHEYRVDFVDLESEPEPQTSGACSIMLR